MHPVLKNLIERKIIVADTILSASVKTVGLGQTPVKIICDLWVKGISNNKYLFCKSKEGRDFYVSYDDIKTIDGTEISRLLKAFNLNEDGQSKK